MIDCLACHNQSGSHGDSITNRVHSRHNTNSTGDLTNYVDGVYTVNAMTGLPSRDWSGITFPAELVNCAQTCHTSGNTSYTTNPFSLPCAGCHIGTAYVTGTPNVLTTSVRTVHLSKLTESSHFQITSGPQGPLT